MRTQVAASAAVVMAAAVMVAVPVQAVDGVTVRHLPAKVKIVDSGFACIEFGPKVSGPSYVDGSVDVTSVAARGMRFPTSYCDPKGKTRKLLMRKAGVTFTVAYTYDYEAVLQGQRRAYTVMRPDGTAVTSGVQRLNAAGQPCDSDGEPDPYDSATEWALEGYQVVFDAAMPWTYTKTAEAAESFTTNVRLMKE